jgi:hypothetical protein
MYFGQYFRSDPAFVIRAVSEIHRRADRERSMVLINCLCALVNWV